MAITRLGPYEGTVEPDYDLRFYRDGDPRRLIRDVNLRSIVAIQTAKQVGDIAGTFTVTLKDRAARLRISEMDATVIRLKGWGDYTIALKGVVDEVRNGMNSDVYAGSEDTVITGRCTAKYLQETSLFLPVWDPAGALPTALIFGLGDVTKKGAAKGGALTPQSIFRYMVRRFTYGQRGMAGVSGIPNSRFWLDHLQRFQDIGFEIPFLQFDEDSMAAALKRFEIPGFTEAWVDELGRVVFRQPQWDAPAAYAIHTGSMKSHNFSRSDLETKTYVEVVPAGDPGIDSATAQALRAGRAPVPSAYVDAAGADSRLGDTVSPEYVIETDSKGKVTTKGARNPWYKKQRRLGMRPLQISSPLLFSQEQAQKQAEGLLDFYSRYTKTGTVVLPLEPGVRLGHNAHVFGPVDGIDINRTYYIEGVAHDYVEGSSATTSLTLTHGRDPWDPKWGRIVLPRVNPADLVANGGVLGTPSGGGPTIADGGALRAWLKKGPTPKEIIDTVIVPLAVANSMVTGTTPAAITAANGRHSTNTASGNRSDHKGPPSQAWASDMSNGGSPTPQMDRLAEQIAQLFGIPWDGSGLITVRILGAYQVQLIYRADDHYNHVHFGLHRI